MNATIDVTYVFPPIPDRQFDYCATWSGYDLGDPQGYGASPAEAVEQLLEMSEGDRDEADHFKAQIDNLSKAIAPILTGFAWDILTEDQQRIVWRGMFAADSVWKAALRSSPPETPPPPVKLSPEQGET